MSIAERVAWERGETLGKSVGYQVYFCGINKTVVVDHNLTFFLAFFRSKILFGSDHRFGYTRVFSVNDLESAPNPQFFFDRDETVQHSHK